MYDFYRNLQANAEVTKFYRNLQGKAGKMTKRVS